jgi:hypothetical protein
MNTQSILNLEPVFTSIEGSESFVSSELEVKPAAKTAPRLAATPKQKENIFSEINLPMAQSLPTEALKPKAFAPAPLFKSPLQASRGQLSMDSRLAQASTSLASTLPASTPTVQSSTATTSRYNTLSTAYSFGTVVATNTANGITVNRSINGSVNSNNLKDYYHFGLDRTVNLEVSLSNLTSNADVRLIRDANNNGRIDAGDVILGSYNPSNVSEAFRVEGLAQSLGERGSYFLEVGSVNRAVTNYTLSFSATTEIPREPAGVSGNTLATAIPIAGQLNGERMFMGSVNADNDISDFYRFTLDQAVKFRGVLTPTLSNANMYLYHDANQNGIIDPGELIGYSAETGISDDIINKEILTPGDYYVQVQKPANTGSTDYMLQLHGTPITKDSRVTVDIHHLKALEQFDARVPFTNWHRADFMGSVWIDSKQHIFGTFQDQDIVTGLKFTQMVDPNKRFIPISIDVQDSDFMSPFNIGGAYDLADINPNKNSTALEFMYDSIKQQLIGSRNTSGFFNENQIVTLKGDGTSPYSDLNAHAAEIQFSVSYDPIF